MAEDSRAAMAAGRWCLVRDLEMNPGGRRHQVAHQDAHLLQGMVQQGEPAGGFQGVLAGLPKLYDQRGLLRDPRPHQVNMFARSA
jgi:hypothetical protein